MRVLHLVRLLTGWIKSLFPWRKSRPDPVYFRCVATQQIFACGGAETLDQALDYLRSRGCQPIAGDILIAGRDQYMFSDGALEPSSLQKIQLGA